MAMATLTSISSLARTLSLADESGNGRDASFSSYANCTEEIFVSKLAESSRNLIPNISAQEEHHLAGKKEDGEIGVFGAEKYFNGGMDEDSPKIAKTVAPRNCLHEKDEKNDQAPIKQKIHPLTPSVQSESSWNSQKALLKSAVRNPPRRKKNRAYAKNLLSGLGCKCYCYDKDSVEVDEQERFGEISFNVVQGKAVAKEHIKDSLDVEHKSPSLSGSSRVQDGQNFDKLGAGLKKDNCFTFPTLNSVAANLPVKKQLPGEEELKARKSLEVFGSPIYERRNKSLSIERRLKMLPWDANPRMEEIEAPARAGGVYNDNESDASSDLFEIESLTGKVTPFLARQGSDATSGCLTPTTCYAPSEASIEWSVVTASAADFSVMSDCEEIRTPTTLPSPTKTFPTTPIAKPTTAKEMPRHRSSSLLGCKSQKSVNIAGDAHVTKEKANFDTRPRRVSDSYMPVTRFQSETKLTGLDSRHRKPALVPTSALPRSY